MKWSKQLEHEGNSVISHLSGLAERQDNARHIHQVRVHIKRMNAILHLLGDEELSSMILREGFRKVLKICGDIRNHQIILENLSGLGLKNKKIILELEEKIYSGIKILVSLKSHLIIKLEHALKQGRAHRKDISSRIIESSYRITMAELFLLFAYLRNKDLHEARKMIKNVIYPASLLAKKTFRQYKDLLNELAELQELIGKWHDMYVTLDYIRKNGPQNSKEIATLKIKEKNSRNQLTQEIKKISLTYAALE